MNKLMQFMMVAAAFTLATGPAAAQTELTEAHVEAAFAAPAFQAAFAGCFSGSGYPAEVTLVVIIDASGGATLSSTDPALHATTTSCIAGAAGKLSFPATGQSFEITYPLATPPASTTPPPPVPGIPPPPVTGQPPYVIGQPVYGAPIQPPVYVDESWKPIYKAGSRKIAGGAVALGIGFILAIPGLALVALSQTYDSLSVYSSSTGDTYRIAGIVLLCTSLIPITAGIIAIGRGKALKRKGLMMRNGQIAYLPLPSPLILPGGGGLALDWVF